MVLGVKYRPTKSKKWADQKRNRRIIQEYGLQEAQRSGFLDIDNNGKKKKQKDKSKNINNKKPKTGTHLGSEYESKYKQFISNGGDPSSCPFD
jgi:hypothetical protein